MTIKAFAFGVQTSLRKASGIALKRSHVHEVLAALFGFASYAALSQQRVLAQHYGSVPEVRLDLQRAAIRSAELGYPAYESPVVAAAVASAVKAAQIYAISLEEVLYNLHVDFDDPHPARADHVDAETALDEEDDDGMLFALDYRSAILRESLTRWADGGAALAHVALARICEEILTDMSTEEEGGDGRYWFEQQQRGQVLHGVELEWATSYGLKHDALVSRQIHLSRATALGKAEAALRQAEIDPTDKNFELAASLAGVPQAARLARVASLLGRDEDARIALRECAVHGDIGAMKDLAGGLETDLKKAWTWIHLARRLIGVDLMAYEAVGEDGLPADADEAGPIYAAGGFELDALSEQDNLEALEAARRIHAGLR